MLARNFTVAWLVASLAAGCAEISNAAPKTAQSAAPAREQGSDSAAPPGSPMPGDAMRGSALAPHVPLAPGSPPPAPPAPGAAKAKEAPGGKAERDDASEIVIYTGFLSEQVDGPKMAAAVDTVGDVAVAMGGYVDKQNDDSIQVKVPSARFRDAMRELEKIGDVEKRSVEAQDVTEEVHDLGVRLKSLTATRERLQDFLKRANNISEVLQVEAELGRVSAEIDRVEGRMRFLQQRAAMSTILVAFKAKPTVEPLKQVEPPPAPPRTLALPIPWLSSIDFDRLLNLTR